MLVSRPQPSSLTGPHVTPLAASVLDGGVDVVAHQVQLVRPASSAGCTATSAGRQLEDQPAAAGVDVRILQHVAEEGPVGVGVAAVHDDMSASDHGGHGTTSR